MDIQTIFEQKQLYVYCFNETQEEDRNVLSGDGYYVTDQDVILKVEYLDAYCLSNGCWESGERGLNLLFDDKTSIVKIPLEYVEALKLEEIKDYKDEQGDELGESMKRGSKGMRIKKI